MNEIMIDKKYLTDGKISKKLNTIFGTARIASNGYFVISSQRQGNRGRQLHRLIFEDFYKIKLPRYILIHHNDENKLNNNIWNLIPLTKSEHSYLHSCNQDVSDETCQKLSESRKGEKNPNYGKEFPLESKIKMSKAQNNTGYFRVSIQKAKNCKQGFMYRYALSENGKLVQFRSVSLEKLKEKVIANGYPWRKLDGTYSNSKYDLIYSIIIKYFDPNLCGGVTECSKEIYDLLEV